MTAARVADILDRAGETVTLRRITGTTSQTNTDASVKASLRQYRADELAGPIIQGDAEAIIAASDAGLSSWPTPPRKGDKIIRDGKHYAVLACETRNYREDAALYVLQVRG